MSNILIEIITKADDKIRTWIKEDILFILEDTLDIDKQKEIIKLIEKGEKGKMDEWLEQIKKMMQR